LRDHLLANATQGITRSIPILLDALIDAVAWEQERVNAKSRGDGRRSSDEVMVEILSHCDILVAHAAANALLHSLGKAKIGDGFGSQVDSRAAFEQLLLSGPFKGFSSEQLMDYASWKEKIEAFDLPNGSVEQRVFAISRRIHGKALLERFFKKYSIQDDKRFSVASRISGRVPLELSARINEWAGC
jgi:chromosome condensin MukBEF ATPase and DNA-binding subunit MukB